MGHPAGSAVRAPTRRPGASRPTARCCSPRRGRRPRRGGRGRPPSARPTGAQPDSPTASCPLRRRPAQPRRAPRAGRRCRRGADRAAARRRVVVTAAMHPGADHPRRGRGARAGPQGRRRAGAPGRPLPRPLLGPRHRAAPAAPARDRHRRRRGWRVGTRRPDPDPALGRAGWRRCTSPVRRRHPGGVRRRAQRRAPLQGGPRSGRDRRRAAWCARSSTPTSTTAPWRGPRTAPRSPWRRQRSARRTGRRGSACGSSTPPPGRCGSWPRSGTPWRWR